VDSHYSVALGVDMAPLRELPNTATIFGLCERGHGGLLCPSSNTKSETQYEVDNRSNPAGESL